MKKIITISIAFLYLIIASGVIINLHYCGGHLKKISLYHVTDEDGCCGDKEKSHGCCKDKTTFIKVKDNHHSNGHLKIALNNIKFNDFIPPQIVVFFDDQFLPIKPSFHDPPVIYDSPIYLQHRVLLI